MTTTISPVTSTISHYNPVRHGYVARVRDWPFSSFHRMVRLGIYPEDWAGTAEDHGPAFGER